MKILAFAASNSRDSINKRLVKFSLSFLPNVESDLLDLNDYEMPIYSTDRENESGISPLVQAFFDKIGEADALLISFAEHNGSYTAAYKNLFDWTSRINQKVFRQKPMVLLSTSPGPGGAARVLASAKDSAPHFGGNVLADVSIPSFYENFDTEKGEITNPELESQIELAMASFKTL